MQAGEGDTHAPTIQGELERSITAIIGTRMPVHGAGRTDAGVHAEGQVCHVDLPEGTQRIDWPRALNVRLAPDIRVLDAQWSGPGFHARKSALRKRYAYSFWAHADKAVPRLQAFVWSCPPLGVERMLAVIPLLTGQRDFASFRNAGGTNGGDSSRRLFAVNYLPGVAAGLVCPPGWPVGSMVFEGDGFLKQMVRNLMGLMVWVGLGKIWPEDIPAIFAAKDRRALPSPSAPAQGLTLLEVLY